jgi:hypothetical protein
MLAEPVALIRKAVTITEASPETVPLVSAALTRDLRSLSLRRKSAPGLSTRLWVAPRMRQVDFLD